MTRTFNIDSNIILMKGVRDDEKLREVIGCYKDNSVMIMDGTTCGNNSWSQKGECVRHENAPRSRG